MKIFLTIDHGAMNNKDFVRIHSFPNPQLMMTLLEKDNRERFICSFPSSVIWFPKDSKINKTRFMKMRTILHKHNSCLHI